MVAMKKSVPYEDAEQKAFVGWLRNRGLLVIHIPNHKNMRKDIGALAGVPDLQIILQGGQVLWVEMKRRKGGRVDPEQKKVHAALKDLGHVVIVAKGGKDAKEQVEPILFG
jgi:hypothetical protein